jgi:hypothetical protein
MAYGGDIIEVTFNNSTVGSGVFKPKAGEGNTYDTGGVRTNDDTKAVTSDGEGIWTQNMQMGFFSITVANDMSVRRDLEKAALLSAATTPTTWTFQVINGAKYRGTGMLVGDLSGDVDKATLVIKVVAPKFVQF